MFGIASWHDAITIIEQEELAAAYRIHCNIEGGYIDGIEYTPYADKAERESKGKHLSSPFIQ